MDEDSKLRTDIQALRGLAVLLVVVYHANLGWLGAGYLGVDIFFVISGFLITSLVAGGIQRGNFSLKEFYFRRAKRLLPAAYVVFGATAVVAPWLLNQQELNDLIWQVLGAVTFTANLFLWQQTGYFDGASELKPLLHTWSLSIEEQYYLLLPAALLFMNPRHWLRALGVAAVGSLALCLWAVTQMPSATFYLLPTRAWELLFGSLGALLVLRPGMALRLERSAAVRWLFLPSLVCLVTVPALPAAGPHPGLGALLVCLATLIVILRRDRRIGTGMPARVLAAVGDFSYSLYLVHWPVLALLRNAYTGPDSDIPVEARMGAAMLSIVLAYGLYRLVEDPIRRARVSFSTPLLAKGMAASLLLLAIAPAGSLAMKGDTNFAHRLRVNFGLSPECEYKSTFEPKPACEAGTGIFEFWSGATATPCISFPAWPYQMEQGSTSSKRRRAAVAQCWGSAPNDRCTQEQEWSTTRPGPAVASNSTHPSCVTSPTNRIWTSSCCRVSWDSTSAPNGYTTWWSKDRPRSSRRLWKVRHPPSLRQWPPFAKRASASSGSRLHLRRGRMSPPVWSGKSAANSLGADKTAAPSCAMSTRESAQVSSRYLMPSRALACQ